MNTEWKKVKLKEVSDFTTGKLNSNAAVAGGEYPFFTCSPETLQIDTYAFDQEALLLAGNNAEGNFSLKYYYGRFNAYQRTYVISSKDKNVLDLKFLYYSLRLCLKLFKDLSQGTATKFLTASILNNFEIVLPPVDIQKSVTRILSAFDDKIELNTQINHNLEEQAKAIFKSWFVDFEPFQDGKFVDSELGQIPAGWQVADVYSIASVIYGAPFASKRFSAEKIGRPIVRIRDLATEAPQVYTDEIHPKGYIIKPGDIVVGMDGEFRAYLWGGEEAWLNQRVCVFQPKDNFSSAFVRLSIMPLLAAVEASEVATTVIHLGRNDIDKFKIILPDAETLRKYNAAAVPIYKQIVENKLESRRLAQLRDTLLPKLMSGEIDVSEVEV